MDIPGAKVTQHVVDALKLRVDVLPILKVHARESLTGVRVHEGQRARGCAVRPERRDGQQRDRECARASQKLTPGRRQGG
jgi:hypothetical protein